MIGIVAIMLCHIVFYSASAMADWKDVITIDRDIQLVHLRDSIYIHVTWHDLEDHGRFPSNGLVVIRNGQALMVDTPMDNDKTERLVRYLKDSLSVEVTDLVIGHFHDDCMGGLEYLQQIGVASITNALTADKCQELELPVPDTPFRDSMVFDFHGERIECRYFGPGHTPDNITVYIPDKQVLFGGCLIRSLRSTSLGNLSDAVVGQWDATVEKIAEAYPDIRIVVPGHGDAGGPELLEHTVDLVKQKLSP